MRERHLRRLNGLSLWLDGAAVAFVLAGCGRPGRGAAGGAVDGPIDADDARACQRCHAEHYDGWSLSMHAYASDDPIFLAMNARGQRETGGALGDFCVRCHAPLAVARGVATGGRLLSELPAALRGVTCVACHTASGNADDPTHLASGNKMRGPIRDAVDTPAHASVYSAAHDRTRPESAELCGNCHAVKNGHGVEIERTIDEWRTSKDARPATLRTCGRCHMPESTGQAAQVPNAPRRRIHAHAMPAVDLGAASPAQRKLVQAAIDPAITARLCVQPGGGGAEVSVTLENARVGHAWPSGATHNRRAWLELVGYSRGAVAYSSGVVAEAETVTASHRPPLLLLREELFEERGQPALFMWNARTTRSLALLPSAAGPELATRTATIWVDGSIDRVTTRVRMRPVDHDVADALVASGDLSPAVASQLPTLTLGGTVIEWTAERGAACLP